MCQCQAAVWLTGRRLLAWSLPSDNYFRRHSLPSPLPPYWFAKPQSLWETTTVTSDLATYMLEKASYPDIHLNKPAVFTFSSHTRGCHKVPRQYFAEVPLLLPGFRAILDDSDWLKVLQTRQSLFFFFYPIPEWESVQTFNPCAETLLWRLIWF